MGTVVAWVAGAVIAALAIWAAVVARRGSTWGATRDEIDAPMPGDAWFDGAAGQRQQMRMTRAVSIGGPPEAVWPWLRQLGRGAGFYSFDTLDNGRRTSADHIVSWIPEPRLGDASAIGYLRHLVRGRELGWWVPGERFLGSETRMAICMRVVAASGGSRLIIRVTADATGGLAHVIMPLFRFIDTVMSKRQLRGLRQRVEEGAGSGRGLAGESGARDQYQLYEVVYASGECAGVAGKERARQWADAARAELGAAFGQREGSA